MWGTNSSSGKSPLFVRSRPVVGLCTRDGIFVALASLHFYQSRYGPLIMCCGGAVQLIFSSFFEEYCPIYGYVGIGVSMGQGEFLIFLSLHLGTPLPAHQPPPLPCTCIFNQGRCFFLNSCKPGNVFLLLCYKDSTLLGLFMD